MGRQKTHEEFVKEVFELVNDEYSVIGVYVKASRKLMMRHNNENCNNFEYLVSPNKFISAGRRCPKCNGGVKKSNKEFLKEVSNVVGDEYTILGNYKNNATPILIRHNSESCSNYEWSTTTPASFLCDGVRCPKCAGNARKGHEGFIKELFELVGEEYTILGNYTNSDNHVLIRHNCKLCNEHEWDVVPTNILKGSRCPKCDTIKQGFKKRILPIDFINKVRELVGDEYSVMTEYSTAKKKVLMRHNNDICNNHEWYITPNKFIIASQRCPRCKESKGERKVREFLLSMGEKFDSQHRLKDCRDKQPLPFDYVVFNNNQVVKTFIEYDGDQHFKSIKIFGGENYLGTVQKHDQIKNEYCLGNHAKRIRLIRIKHTEFDNIELILQKELIDNPSKEAIVFYPNSNYYRNFDSITIETKHQ